MDALLPFEFLSDFISVVPIDKANIWYVYIQKVIDILLFTDFL
jgi:hypothetical protein